MPVNRDYAPQNASGGMVPPADAPREVSQPLAPEVIEQQLAAARQNERELKPLAFEHTPPPVSGVEALQSGFQRKIRQVKRDRPAVDDDRPAVGDAALQQQIVLTDGDAPRVKEPSVSDISKGAVDGAVDAIQPHQRAGSNSDSPSRGMPRTHTDPGKAVTGGFGDAGVAQYYPLDGSEVRAVASALCDQLKARMLDDLRFSMAVTYPRVRVRAELIVEAWPVDQTMSVAVVARPHDRTPLDVAREHADECVFVLAEERREMSAEGESITPPNEMRQEQGLQIPRKQAIEAPGGRVIVDVVAQPPGPHAH